MIYTLTLNPAVDRELAVPAIAFDTVLRAGGVRVDVGGKGFNVSRQLRSLGLASTAVGFLGGRAGELLQDGLRTLGIGVDFVWVPGETRTNVSVVTTAHDHYLKVNEPGPAIPPAQQDALLSKVEALAAPGDWWALAGSLPPGVSDDFYARIVAQLNRRGASAILDTSGPALRLGCGEQPFLVKPNREEAQAITGLAAETPAEWAALAAGLRRLGAQNVVLSLGKAGALLQTSAGTWLARSPRVEERNPIGAGDSVVGGLVWALAQGLPLPDAVSWGVACGAATASLSGTAVGDPTLVDELHAQVRLEAIHAL